MKAYVMINVRSGEISQVVNQLRRVNGITEANMTFGPYDVVAVLTADNINHMGIILAKEIQPIPGILETLTCLAVES